MQIEKFNEKKLQKEIEEFEKDSKKLFISTDDTTVCWRIWGKGQPIIFLHGGYGSWRHWIKQVTYLSKDYQILVPDMPGFGESSDLKSDHTPENISLNLFALLPKLLVPLPSGIISWSTADRSLATSPKLYLPVDELYFNAKPFC